VDDIKQKTDSWTPHDPEDNPLKNYSSEQLNGLLGTVIRGTVGGMEPPAENVDLPESFDAREKWGSCVHAIRDQ
jgi:hypothetical protein